MRIAFPYIDRRLWQGGFNYLLNLLGALDMLDESTIAPFVFAGDDIPMSDLAPFAALPSTTVIRHRHFRRDRIGRRQVLALATGKDGVAENLYGAHEIAGVFENAFFHGARTKYPILAWIPDFQHKHLPKLFSRRRYWKRELGFRMQLAYRSNVLLSSQDAKNDLYKFYPGFAKQAHILRFCAALPSEIGEIEIESLREKYSLPQKFIFLPNQFYFHKNHVVVAEALRIMRKTGKPPTVVASGSISGSADTNSVHELRKLIEHYKLDSNFIILGSVPYLDVLGLMRISTATLNPSLFEGWSTTVEEAKALGVQLVLSDIGVHKEQMDDRALLFDPGKPGDLADKLRIVLNSAGHDPHMQSSTRVLEANQSHRVQVARQFADILKTSFHPRKRQDPGKLVERP